MSEVPRADAARASEPRLLTLGTALGGLVLPMGAALVCAAIEPEAGEARVLRWLRVVDDHPLRAYLAGVLLILAVRARAGGERDPSARS